MVYNLARASVLQDLECICRFTYRQKDTVVHVNSCTLWNVSRDGLHGCIILQNLTRASVLQDLECIFRFTSFHNAKFPKIARSKHQKISILKVLLKIYLREHFNYEVILAWSITHYLYYIKNKSVSLRSVLTKYIQNMSKNVK